MSSIIKAKFSNGVLKPLENIDLQEGDEVAVTIASLAPRAGSDWLERTAGGWAGLVDAEVLKRNIFERRHAPGRSPYSLDVL